VSFIPKWIRQLVASQILRAIDEVDAQDLLTFKAMVAAVIIRFFRV
jgi:hypothetical protein